MRRTSKITNCSTHLNKGSISEKHMFTGKSENSDLFYKQGDKIDL